MTKLRILALALLFLGGLIGFFVFSTEKDPNSKFPFNYGLDLDGGTHLTYRADTSNVAPGDTKSSLDSLRRTIERRVNSFGVSEPIVSIEKVGLFSDDADKNRLIVELPGVTDVSKAVDLIGKTPLLEFRILKDDASLDVGEIGDDGEVKITSDIIYNSYEATGLGGGQLKRASVSFDNISNEPSVVVEYNSDGSKLFAEITRDNVGKIMGIFIDKELIQAPVIRQEILGGSAVISGSYSRDEAKQLAEDLNFGALPLPIELIETQTIGASLGHETLTKGVTSLVWAFAVISIFLVIWYRIPGLVATVSLVVYAAVMLALFKLIPVTLTASGVAGFILSLGMTVDANVLIFERIKEELRLGRPLRDAAREGFNRAWLPIRDGNLSSIISAVVLFWLSGTPVVQGFALVFGIGVIVSMITAVAISRTLLISLTNEKTSGALVRLFGSGILK